METQKGNTNKLLTCLGIGCGSLIVLGVAAVIGIYAWARINSTDEAGAVSKCTLREIIQTINPDFNPLLLTKSGVSIDRGLAEVVASQKSLSNLKISPPALWGRDVKNGCDHRIGNVKAEVTIDEKAKVEILFVVENYSSLGISCSKLYGIQSISIHTEEWREDLGQPGQDNRGAFAFVLGLYVPFWNSEFGTLSNFVKKEDAAYQERKLREKLAAEKQAKAKEEEDLLSAAMANSRNGKAQYAYALFLEKNGRSQEAVNWIKKAANNGVIEAQYRYGALICKYAHGDEACEGFVWVSRAADQRHPEAAQYLIDNFYGPAASKEDREKLKERMFKLFQLKQKDSQQPEDSGLSDYADTAIKLLGPKEVNIEARLERIDPLDMKNDDLKILTALSQTEKPPVKALCLLAAYYDSLGGAGNHGQAIRLYKKAAERNCVEAMTALGKCYLKGGESAFSKGPDIHNAELWLQKAADIGDENAKKALQELHK